MVTIYKADGKTFRSFHEVCEYGAKNGMCIFNHEMQTIKGKNVVFVELRDIEAISAPVLDMHSFAASLLGFKS